MKRRQFVTTLLTGASWLGAKRALGATYPIAKPAGEQAVSAKRYYQQFHEAAAKEARLLGFTNNEADFKRTELHLGGSLPKGFAGTLLRNGPARYERDGCRLGHLFEGDGMVQRFTFGNGRVFHDGRFLRTPKFEAEQRAGKFLYSGPDTSIPNGLPVHTRDVINTANTSILPVGEDLWALWEGGSAAKLDPESLAFEHFVDLGAGSDYGKTLQGLPFSAHPKVDPNGDIWNFGLLDGGKLVIYHLSPCGKVRKVALLATDYQAGLLHDFLITERHLLFILPSLARQSEAEGLFTGIRYDPQQPMRVLVVDKHSLALKRSYELAAGFAFHFGNAWEERDGTIRFDASLYPNTDVMDGLGWVMRGQILSGAAASQTALFMLKPSGQVEQTLFANNSEFPRVSAAFTGRKNRYLFFTEAKHSSFWNDSVACIDLSTQKQSQYYYGDGFMVEEHIPISRSPNEEAEFVIGTALHVPSKRTCVNIFNAGSLADGPLARAWLDHHLPLGFHGHFVWDQV